MAVILCFIFNSVLYLANFFTIPIGYGWFSISCGLILLIVELLGMSEFFIHFLNVTKLIVPVKPEVVDKELYPHVDVYIATYNECPPAPWEARKQLPSQ